MREVVLKYRKEALAELWTQLTFLHSLSRLVTDGSTLNQTQLNTLLLEYKSIPDLSILGWPEDPKYPKYEPGCSSGRNVQFYELDELDSPLLPADESEQALGDVYPNLNRLYLR